MTQVVPRELLHQGVVEASGFLFDARMIGAKEAQRRILELWRPGAELYQLPEGLLLRLPSPLNVPVRKSSGLPFVAKGDRLVSTPLTEADLKVLSMPSNAVALMSGGNVIVRTLSTSARIDPSLWVEMSEWTVLRTQTLGAPPAPPRDTGASPTFDVRSDIPGIPPADPERAAVLEALRRAALTKGVQNDTGAAGSGLGEQVAGWLSRIADNVRRVAEANDAKPLSDLAQKAAMRLLVSSGLAARVGRQQAEYIAKMMEMFERGDIESALRHAISLGEMDGQDLPPSLSTLNPRDSLSIPSHHTPAGSSVNMSPELYEHLASLYRQAFRQLEREGRIEEAAFVLAELLHSVESAVSFLERHKRYQLAAQLAESRELEPGLVVRLWFLADDAVRAVKIARKHKAFADAVQRLERDKPELARDMRLYWGVELAESGDYARAFEAVRPILDEVWSEPTVREPIQEWMDAAIANGGVGAARMLAYKLELVPEAEEEIRQQARLLLEDESTETIPERHAFTEVLGKIEQTLTVKTLARAAVRAAIRDAALSPLRMEKEAFRKLLRSTGDGALRSDAPVLPAFKGGLHNDRLDLTLAALDGGLLPIYDVAFLVGGRCLVALGEMGVRLLARDGRTIVHWEQPAHRLVVSDQGDRALVLAPRGDAWRIARLDLATRTAKLWVEAALRSFASDYDGTLWYVAFERDFLAVDVLADGFDVLWRLPRVSGSVLALARSELQCSFLLFSAGVTDEWGRPAGLWTRLELCTFSLPNFYLTERTEVPQPPEKSVEGKDYARGFTPGGTLYMVLPAQESANRWNVTLFEPIAESKKVVAVYEEAPALFPPVVGPNWLLLPVGHTGGVDCLLLDRKRLNEYARIRLSGAKQVTARFSLNHLVLGDDRGRLLVLDLERGELIRNLRLR